MNRKSVNKKTVGKAEQKAISKGQVRQMIKSALEQVQELKYFVSGDSAVSTNYDGFCGDASGVSQGDTDSTRDGDRIYLEEFDFRWTATLGDSTNLVRCILFQWKPDSAVDAPDPAQILGLISDVRSPLSTFTIDTAKLYRVLYDKTLVLDTYHPVREDIVTIRKFWDRQVQYTGSTTGTNKLWKLFISDSSAATHPTVSSWGQIRFTDS